jgi:hypothetical protein
LVSNLTIGNATAGAGLFWFTVGTNAYGASETFFILVFGLRLKSLNFLILIHYI